LWPYCVVLAIVCLAVVRGDGAALPSNLTASAIFQPALERMWQLSPTFRRQCRRLSAARQLHVNLLLEELARHPSSYHARASMRHRNGVLVSSDIHLARLDDPVELIAHEIEHVIEQLDQVDLQAHARSGTVWKRDDGAFETRRAIAIGRRVAHEMSDAAQADTPQGARAIALQDRFPVLAGPPSARVNASGRYVVFASYAALVPADGNTRRDVYVMDVATRRVTLETSGADGESLHPDISRDGRFVVFESTAGNLTNVALARGIPRVFLRDRQTGAIRLLSTNTRGEPANGPSLDPAISADGEAVVFASSASDLLEGESTIAGGIGVYLIRLTSNERSRVDVTSDGLARAGQSALPAISADGRHVAFMSKADLTAGDGNGAFDIYVRDTVVQRTRRVSQGDAGRDTNGPSYHPSISGDGRFVAFASEAANLVPGGSKRVAQVYLRDMETGATELISHAPAARPADAVSARPIVSGDGLVVAYQSLASNLLCDGKCNPAEVDINLLWDVYVYDRLARRTIRASRDDREEWMESSGAPSLDETGRLLAFASLHPTSPDDQDHDEDLFVVDLSPRGEATPTGSARSTSDRTGSCCAGPGSSSRPATRPAGLARRAP
jgi:Tol biopolymer transport system component